MRQPGLYMMIIGILAIGLHFLHFQFIFLRWIDEWSTLTGWLIRFGIVVFSFLLWLTGKLFSRDR